MADSEQSGQERTYDPSAKRLEDARREGQVPRSRDLAHLIVLGAAAGLILMQGSALIGAGVKLVARGLTLDPKLATDTALMSTRLEDLAASALLAVAPMLGTLFLAALAAPLVIGGWMFVPNLVLPNPARMNPLEGFKRLLSVAALVELGKVLIVALMLASVGAAFVLSRLDNFAALAGQALAGSLSHFGSLFAVAFLLLVTVLAVTAAIDVPFQIFHHRSKLKMTLEEVKKEQKEIEGDPQIKARVRSAQRELARRRMMAAVPKADVVVTNPTHFAVALRYAEGRTRAPIVVAKGADAVAQKIRELAQEHGVPQLEAPPLARALYKHVELGAEIPAALYGAVAQVLAYVYQLKRFAQGQGPRPSEPREIEVPPGFDPLEPLASA